MVYDTGVMAYFRRLWLVPGDVKHGRFPGEAASQ